MKRLTLHTAKSYDILIGPGLLRSAGPLIREVTSACRAVVVTDSNVGPLYAQKVSGSLKDAGFETDVCTFPAGEPSKTLNTIADFYAAFAKAGLTRRDIVVALGGGVCGDMAGFAAATYLRGMDFVQIPTSLLAQVDSSVGGKTGVDLPVGKNLVGAFHQPRLVLCDTDVLGTLPPAFFQDGMGEVIKYGCIKSLSLFELLETEQNDGVMEEAIVECVDIKRGVVERDERETGERMLLNFGHTAGHAIERCANFTGLSHGQAVGVGMVIAARAGESLGLTQPGTADRAAALLKRYGLPTHTQYSAGELARAAMTDKKRAGGALNFVFLRGIGDSFVKPVPMEELEDVFERGMA